MMAESKTEDIFERGTSLPSIPAATEQEREMSQQATNEFNKRNYEGCSNILNKISTTRSMDPKVIHNKAVIDYYKSNFVKTDEFRVAMAEVCQRGQINIESLAGLDDVDQCVIYFNQAVILYHLRQYKSALAIADKLFTFLEPMEETLARRVLFLLIELYLCTNQPEKAITVLSFTEKQLFGNGKSQLPSPDKEGKEGMKDGKDSSPDSSAHPNEVWRPKISQYKARCFLMLKSMKSCKREIKNLMNTAGMTTPVVYLKASFEHLRHNHRKAIKVLNSGPSQPKTTAETGEHLPTYYYNNLGVIHFHMKKHNLGLFYFKKAMQENETACKVFNKVDPGKSLSGRPIQAVGLSRHYELLYNIGIQLLHCGQPTAAFDCLMQTVQMYQINPRLWLRLAECCIMSHKENNEEDKQLSKRLEVIKGCKGNGIHRKLIIGPGLESKQSGSESAAMPVATLEFAALCLRNALLLLPEDPSKETVPLSDDESETKTSPENLLVHAPPGNPLRRSEVESLRCSVLASSAYVALCLNDHLVALGHAENLLKQPNLSGALRYVGQMYLAEASVQLDRIAGAVTQLNPDTITDINTVPPQHKEQEREKNGERDSQETGEATGALYPWTPKDLQKAKAIMQYNLATAHAIRGEYEKALMNLNKSIQDLGMPLPAQMYFLTLYLELMEGRRKTVQTIIKEHFSHVSSNKV